MKVWISRYALSMGIIEAEAEPCGDEFPGMIQVARDKGSSDYYHGEGRDWHRTRQAAVIFSTVARDKKVASLEKQIAKLKTLTFKEK